MIQNGFFSHVSVHAWCREGFLCQIKSMHDAEYLFYTRQSQCMMQNVYFAPERYAESYREGILYRKWVLHLTIALCDAA